MARLTVLRIVALALVVLAATASPTAASVVTIGDVDPGGAAIQPDPWAVGGNLIVGAASHGTLSVIPEPATLSLLAVGMLTACRRRRRWG